MRLFTDTFSVSFLFVRIIHKKSFRKIGMKRLCQMVSGELKWWTAGTMEQGANRSLDGRRNWVYFKSVYQAPLYSEVYLLDKKTYEVRTHNSLSLVFLLLFLFSMVAQVYFGIQEYNKENVEEGSAVVGMAAYLRSGHFRQATFENWESEFFCRWRCLCGSLSFFTCTCLHMVALLLIKKPKTVTLQEYNQLDELEQLLLLILELKEPSKYGLSFGSIQVTHGIA
jgi:hypothetical protein